MPSRTSSRGDAQRNSRCIRYGSNPPGMCAFMRTSAGAPSTRSMVASISQPSAPVSGSTNMWSTITGSGKDSAGEIRHRRLRPGRRPHARRDAETAVGVHDPCSLHGVIRTLHRCAGPDDDNASATLHSVGLSRFRCWGALMKRLIATVALAPDARGRTDAGTARGGGDDVGSSRAAHSRSVTVQLGTGTVTIQNLQVDRVYGERKRSSGERRAIVVLHAHLHRTDSDVHLGGQYDPCYGTVTFSVDPTGLLTVSDSHVYIPTTLFTGPGTGSVQGAGPRVDSCVVTVTGDQADVTVDDQGCRHHGVQRRRRERDSGERGCGRP